MRQTACAPRGTWCVIKLLAEIWNAEGKDHARAAVKALEAACGVRFPKATAKITDERGRAAGVLRPRRALGASADHQPESTFATVSHRTKVTTEPRSRAAGLAMAFKLFEAAQDRRCAVNAPHLVALVRARASFERGILIERREIIAA